MEVALLTMVRANFADIYLQGMRDRRMRSGTELAHLSTAGEQGKPLEFKYRVMFLLVLGVVYTLYTKCRWIAILLMMSVSKKRGIKLSDYYHKVCETQSKLLSPFCLTNIK